MPVTVKCDRCTARLKLEAHRAAEYLVSRGEWRWGSDDPRAVVMRALTLDGWVMAGGEIGKSTVTMRCPQCTGEPLVLEADPSESV